MMVSLWLLYNAAVYLVVGAFFVVDLPTVAGNLGLYPLNGSAAIELVAVYGGLEIGLGILCIMALFAEKVRLFALQVLMASYVCFALGRFAGMMIHEVTDSLTYLLFGLEVAGFFIGVYLHRTYKTDDDKRTGAA